MTLAEIEKQLKDQTIFQQSLLVMRHGLIESGMSKQALDLTIDLTIALMIGAFVLGAKSQHEQNPIL